MRQTKKMLLGTAMGGILLGHVHEASAGISPEMGSLPPLMKEMASIIDRSSNTDMNDAQGQLCKEGGLLRGRLLTAGKNCMGQDPARMALLICEDVTDFSGSTCDKNIDKALGAAGKRETFAAVMNSVKEGKSNVYKLVCTGDDQFKRKLPGKLKDMAQYCPGGAAPAHPSSTPPAQSSEIQESVKKKVIDEMNHEKSYGSFDSFSEMTSDQDHIFVQTDTGGKYVFDKKTGKMLDIRK